MDAKYARGAPSDDGAEYHSKRNDEVRFDYNEAICSDASWRRMERCRNLAGRSDGAVDNDYVADAMQAAVFHSPRS